MGPPCTHLNLPSKAPNIYITKKMVQRLYATRQDVSLELQPLQVPYSITKVFLVGIEKPFQLPFQLVTHQLFSMGHEGEKLYISC
jgi:hypothetical protein